MLEKEIQAQIVKYLKSIGFFVIRLKSVTPNGIPDLLAIRDGYVCFIEVKRPGQRMRPLQMHRATQIKAQSVDVFCFDGVGKVKEVLK